MWLYFCSKVSTGQDWVDTISRYWTWKAVKTHLCSNPSFKLFTSILEWLKQVLVLMKTYNFSRIFNIAYMGLINWDLMMLDTETGINVGLVIQEWVKWVTSIFMHFLLLCLRTGACWLEECLRCRKERFWWG